MNIKFLLFLLFILTIGNVNADTELTIINLKNRTAKEVIPLIKPFIAPSDTLTGMGYQLIVRTTPERLTDIHKILEEFDRLPRRLIIHVHQGHLTEEERQQLNIGVNADIGKHATIEAGERTKNNSVRLRARTQHTKRDHDITQYIQTLEGKKAFISTGKLIPVREQHTYITRGEIYQQQTTRFQDATTGFYVTPRLNGDQVTLQITPHMKQHNQTDGSFKVQQASTTLSGHLGEWLAVGGSEQNSNRKGTGLTRYRSTQRNDSQQIYLLVEEIH